MRLMGYATCLAMSLTPVSCCIRCFALRIQQVKFSVHRCHFSTSESVFFLIPQQDTGKQASIFNALCTTDCACDGVRHLLSNEHTIPNCIISEGDQRSRETWTVHSLRHPDPQNCHERILREPKDSHLHSGQS